MTWRIVRRVMRQETSVVKQISRAPPAPKSSERKARPLRDVGWAVAVKLALLLLLSQLFFSSSQRPRIDADAVGQHLFTNPHLFPNPPGVAQ